MRLGAVHERTQRARGALAALAAAVILVSGPRAGAIDLFEGKLQLYGSTEIRVGTWLQSDPTTPILIPGITRQPDDDLLAVLRTSLQLEADWRPDSRTELHAVLRLAWEPRYPVDKYANYGSRFGAWKLPGRVYDDPSSSEEILREVWIRRDLLPGQTLRVGRQVVNWGESLAFRVADVINPNDGKTSLFFLDPQDSRIPQWMAQGLHDFPNLRGAPSFEWIVVPPLDHRRQRVNELADTGSRFAIPPEQRPSRFPFFRDQGLPGLWTIDRAAAKGGAVDFRFLDNGNKEFPPGWRFGARTRFTIGPLELALFDWYGYTLLPVVEDRGLLPFTIADYGGALGRPDLQAVYTALGVPQAAQGAIPLNAFAFVYPRQNVVGATGNAYIAPLRAVTRFEFAWRPNKTFQIDGFNGDTGVITDRNGLIKRDEISWQIAFDFGGIYLPKLNRQGDFTFNIEYTQAIVLNHRSDMRVGVYETRLPRVSDAISLRASTVYGFNTLRPSVLFLYQPEQEAMAAVVALGLTAPWDENLSAELRLVVIDGKSRFAGLGFFQRKDFAMFSLRYDL